MSYIYSYKHYPCLHLSPPIQHILSHYKYIYHHSHPSYPYIIRSRPHTSVSLNFLSTNSFGLRTWGFPINLSTGINLNGISWHSTLINVLYTVIFKLYNTTSAEPTETKTRNFIHTVVNKNIV